LDNGSVIIYKRAGESFLILMRRVSSLGCELSPH
jgi:hypothetical protein